MSHEDIFLIWSRFIRQGCTDAQAIYWTAEETGLSQDVVRSAVGRIA